MADNLALYFGFGSGGHFLRGVPFPDQSRSTSLDPVRDIPGFPWDIGLLDGGLLNNRKVVDWPDGRVNWTCGGRPDFWFAFFWWDRSGDTRGASNSGFYVRWPMETVTRENVEREAPRALAFAADKWPDVIARQHFPLVLVDLPPPQEEPRP
jgi:hypothetical protein